MTFEPGPGFEALGSRHVSMLFRGLWADGDGDLRVSSSTVFLPQEPYIPEGSLRRVLTFPEEAWQEDGGLVVSTGLGSSKTIGKP